MITLKELDEEGVLLYCKEKEEQYPGNLILHLLVLEYCNPTAFRYYTVPRQPYNRPPSPRVLQPYSLQVLYSTPATVY